MRTFNEILDIHIDRSIMSPAEEKAIHAAMKEAREEYGEKLLEWFNKLTPVERVTVWSETKGVFNMTNKQLILKFNAHLAAEAEKERGKG